MPVIKNRPVVSENAETLIQAIACELDEDEEEGGSYAPRIIEDYSVYSERFTARVIWTRWKDVPPTERVPIVLEGYRRSMRANDVPNLTTVRGLTEEEVEWEQRARGVFSSPA